MFNNEGVGNLQRGLDLLSLLLGNKVIGNGLFIKCQNNGFSACLAFWV